MFKEKGSIIKIEEKRNNKELISFLNDVNQLILENQSILKIIFKNRVFIFNPQNIKRLSKFLFEIFYKIPKNTPPHIAFQIYEFGFKLFNLISSFNKKVEERLKIKIENELTEDFIRKIIEIEIHQINNFRKESLKILNENVPRRLLIQNGKAIETADISEVHRFFDKYIRENIELPEDVTLTDVDISRIYVLTFNFLNSEISQEVKEKLYSGGFVYYNLLYAIAEAIKKRLEVKYNKKYEIEEIMPSKNLKKKIKIKEKNKEIK